MRPARLAFLAGKHRQFSKVISRKWSPSGTIMVLECGHSVDIAPHFDCSKTETFGCQVCGADYVKNAAQYANEFKGV